MTDPGSQRSKGMPQNCPAEIADEKPSRRQFVDLKLIDHGKNHTHNKVIGLLFIPVAKPTPWIKSLVNIAHSDDANTKNGRLANEQCFKKKLNR